MYKIICQAYLFFLLIIGKLVRKLSQCTVSSESTQMIEKSYKGFIRDLRDGQVTFKNI